MKLTTHSILLKQFTLQNGYLITPIKNWKFKPDLAIKAYVTFYVFIISLTIAVPFTQNEKIANDFAIHQIFIEFGEFLQLWIKNIYTQWIFGMSRQCKKSSSF